MDGPSTIASVAAALVLIFTSVITPVLIGLNKKIYGMEKELKECHAAREEAVLWRGRLEERLRLLEKTAIVARILAKKTDGQLVIMSASSGAETLFGWRSNEMIGKSVAELISAKDRAAHESASEIHSADYGFARKLNGGVALHRDGTEFPVEVNLEVIELHGEPVWSAEILRS